MNKPNTISDNASIRLIIIASVYYAQIAVADGDASALDWIQDIGARWLESIGIDADRTISQWITNGCPSPGRRVDIVKQYRRHENRISRDLEAKARTPQAATA